MINKMLGMPVFAFSLILSGCFDSASNPPESSSQPVLAANISGGTTDITGTWAFKCSKNEGETDKQTFYIISDGTVTVTEKTFSSTDATCKGSVTDESSAVTSLTLGSVAAVIGWADEGGPVGSTAVPTAQDQSGPLSVTESYTSLDITVTKLTGSYLTSGSISVGDKFQLGLVIDDTGTKVMAYATYEDESQAEKRYANQTETLTKQ